MYTIQGIYMLQVVNTLKRQKAWKQGGPTRTHIVSIGSENSIDVVVLLELDFLVYKEKQKTWKRTRRFNSFSGLTRVQR